MFLRTPDAWDCRNDAVCTKYVHAQLPLHALRRCVPRRAQQSAICRPTWVPGMGGASDTTMWGRATTVGCWRSCSPAQHEFLADSKTCCNACSSLQMLSCDPSRQRRRHSWNACRPKCLVYGCNSISSSLCSHVWIAVRMLRQIIEAAPFR